MKGVLLAAGSGSRLRPLTDFVCKPLLPIYDKPMLYYPLTTLMSAGIRDIMIVCTPHDSEAIIRTLGDGSRWGINLNFAVQPEPNGPLEGLLCAKDFIGNDDVSLIFGDNIFVSDSLGSVMSSLSVKGATIFAKEVTDPGRFGVVEFDHKKSQVIGLEEKPKQPKSNIASIGLYRYDSTLFDRLNLVGMGHRGERDIIDLNLSYMSDKSLHCYCLEPTDRWIDAGLFESLFEASAFIRQAQQHSNLIGCPVRESYLQGWISQEQLDEISQRYLKNSYGKSLLSKQCS